MRGRPVDLMASFGHAWRRFFPLIGTVFFMGLLVSLAFLLFVVPGHIYFTMRWYVPIPVILLTGLQLVVPVLILLTMWSVAIPACVVEQTGPWMSLSRSAALTNGNRWKVFGMMTLVIIISGIGAALIKLLAKAAGATVGLLAALIWNALFGAFFAILMGVTYHDLRVAKEGVDTDQIGAAFE
jgi:heme/copper-type cytochrome/quinol oxidase subunit 3